MLQFLATSKNGVRVMYDPEHSHAATHLQDTPELKTLVQEVINALELTGEEIARHYDMRRVVGVCDVVAVDDSDDIVYAVRKNREDDGPVPFVKNRRGDPCQHVAIHLVPQTDGTYLLSSAWIGKFGTVGVDDEPFPLAKNANERSAAFWSKHAFIYGSQKIIPGTETKERPW